MHLLHLQIQTNGASLLPTTAIPQSKNKCQCLQNQVVVVSYFSVSKFDVDQVFILFWASLNCLFFVIDVKNDGIKWQTVSCTNL
jgi:hypothetical protein